MKSLLKPISGACLAVLLLASCGGDGKFSLAKSTAASEISTCLTKMKKKKYEDAIQCFEAYRSINLGNEQAALASLAIGDAYFLQKEYLVAAEAYNLFIEQHPGNSQVPYAYYRAGQCYLNEAPRSVDRDQGIVDSAIKALGAVVAYYPSSEYAAVANDLYRTAKSRLARQNYDIGRFYYKYGEYLAAIPRFETVLTDYPQLGLDEKSFFYLIRSLKKADQEDLAAKYHELFQQHFPQSDYLKKLVSK
jgi:outer membrane protein assembly factor BamD